MAKWAKTSGEKNLIDNKIDIQETLTRQSTFSDLILELYIYPYGRENGTHSRKCNGKDKEL